MNLSEGVSFDGSPSSSFKRKRSPVQTRRSLGRRRRPPRRLSYDEEFDAEDGTSEDGTSLSDDGVDISDDDNVPLGHRLVIKYGNPSATQTVRPDQFVCAPTDRAEFLRLFFRWHRDAGNPLNRLPVITNTELDPYVLFWACAVRGGFRRVVLGRLFGTVVRDLLGDGVYKSSAAVKRMYIRFVLGFESFYHDGSVEPEFADEVPKWAAKGSRRAAAQQGADADAPEPPPAASANDTAAAAAMAAAAAAAAHAANAGADVSGDDSASDDFLLAAAAAAAAQGADVAKAVGRALDTENLMANNTTSSSVAQEGNAAAPSRPAPPPLPAGDLAARSAFRNESAGERKRRRVAALQLSLKLRSDKHAAAYEEELRNAVLEQREQKLKEAEPDSVVPRKRRRRASSAAAAAAAANGDTDVHVSVMSANGTAEFVLDFSKDNTYTGIVRGPRSLARRVALAWVQALPYHRVAQKANSRSLVVKCPLPGCHHSDSQQRNPETECSDDELDHSETSVDAVNSKRQIIEDSVLPAGALVDPNALVPFQSGSSLALVRHMVECHQAALVDRAPDHLKQKLKERTRARNRTVTEDEVVQTCPLCYHLAKENEEIEVYQGTNTLVKHLRLSHGVLMVSETPRSYRLVSVPDVTAGDSDARASLEDKQKRACAAMDELKIAYSRCAIVGAQPSVPQSSAKRTVSDEQSKPAVDSQKEHDRSLLGATTKPGSKDQRCRPATSQTTEEIAVAAAAAELSAKTKTVTSSSVCSVENISPSQKASTAKVSQNNGSSAVSLPAEVQARIDRLIKVVDVKVSDLKSDERHFAKLASTHTQRRRGRPAVRGDSVDSATRGGTPVGDDIVDDDRGIEFDDDAHSGSSGSILDDDHESDFDSEDDEEEIEISYAETDESEAISTESFEDIDDDDEDDEEEEEEEDQNVKHNDDDDDDSSTLSAPPPLPPKRNSRSEQQEAVATTATEKTSVAATQQHPGRARPRPTRRSAVTSAMQEFGVAAGVYDF